MRAKRPGKRAYDSLGEFVWTEIFFPCNLFFKYNSLCTSVYRYNNCLFGICIKFQKSRQKLHKTQHIDFYT